jgi:tetrahydromethanopterin S-methyltransferase subunit E
MLTKWLTVLVEFLVYLTVGLAILTPIIVITVDVVESKKRVVVGRQSYHASLDKVDENYWREYL